MIAATIRARKPCCARHTQLAVLPGVPRQRYTRRCARCAATWDIERVTLSNAGGRRVDQVTFWDTAGTEYRRFYGV